MAKQHPKRQSSPSIQPPTEEHKFTHAKAEDYTNVVWVPDVDAVRLSIYGKYFEPFKLPMPGHVLKQLSIANTAIGKDRTEAIVKAEGKAEMSYLAARVKGLISVGPTKPMPEETKELLKQRNAAKREAIKKEKEERAAALAKTDTNNKSSATIAPKKSGPKVPVYIDQAAQAAAKAKYPHIIEGTFKQDPEKAGGTCVDIKCTKCGSPRTIHLSDAFQCKVCRECRAKM